MSFELGEQVRPSDSYLATPRRYRWLNKNSVGKVTGYRGPKLVQGEHIGVIDVLWDGTGMSVPMRWDQVERAYD